VNDKLLIDDWSDHTSETHTQTIDLLAGDPYSLRLEYYQATGPALVRLQWLAPNSEPQSFSGAVDAAAHADAAVVVVGLDNNIEGEDLDPPDLHLPGMQEQLIRAVSAANPKTIVILVNGTPIDMTPWLRKVKGVIETWYSGQEAGNAIAGILYGDIDPSGKLPDSIAVRREDYSDYGNYPADANGNMHYAEGIYVGYRHFDKAHIEPLFPFGFGLSYTKFAYSRLRVDAPARIGASGEKVSVQFDIANIGARAGGEVAEVYVRDLHPQEDRPVRELKGFQRVFLLPHQKTTVRISLDSHGFAWYDARISDWRTDPGAYEVEVAASSRDIRLQKEINIHE
jgi:beta-glucosidase